MLKVSQLLIAGLVVIMAPRLHAECTYPEDVVIPDGTASTYEEMRDSQAFVKEYLAEMETYLKCLEKDESPRSTELTGNAELRRTRTRHAAIDAMESVAARFNEQVRAFKKANP